MKKLVLVLVSLFFGLGLFAKDIKTLVVTTVPQMHCAACENRIKKGIRFEKGVKEITTNVSEQKITIKYDADKNSEKNLIKAFEKIGYSARKVKEGEKIQKNESETCDMM